MAILEVVIDNFTERVLYAETTYLEGDIVIKKLLIIAALFSRCALMAQGNDVTLETNADGSKTVKEPDGTTMQFNPDGSKITKEPDGTVTKEMADGQKHVEHPDGTTVDVKPGNKRL